MTDPHFMQKGDVIGHDPRLRLQAAIDHVNFHHSDSKMCVISGDMVNHGTRSDYEGVQAKLENLSVPYLPMVGNHDNRDLFRDVFSLPKSCMKDFIQYKLELPEEVIICLDTHKIGSDAGEFCTVRKEWLFQTLTEAGDTPVIIFMHHPPMPLGLPMQDMENMENGQALLELIFEFDCVKYPFSTMRSVLHQAPPPRPEWTWDTFKPSIEAPNIGIIHIESQSINLHYDQFCEYQLGVNTP